MADRQKAAPEHDDHSAAPAEDSADSGGRVDKVVFVGVVVIAATVFAFAPARGSASHKTEKTPATSVRELAPPPPEPGEVAPDEEGEAEFEIIEEEEELPEGDPLLEPDEGEPELELEPPSAPGEPEPPPTAAPKPVAPPAPAPQAPKQKPKPKPKAPAAPKAPSGDNPY